MTTPSFNSTLGISISAFRPTIVAGGAYTPNGNLITDQLAQNADTYSHELLANGGWWSASLSISGSLVEMENWIDDGLNRHIEVYNFALEKIWEGFVNMVTLSAGTLQATRGPLMDVANRASVVYTPILDPTTAPPIEGSETTTTIANNAASQAKYGIFEQVLSGGRKLDDGTTDEAVELRDTTLQESREPETSEDVNLGSSSIASVTLDLLGYVHRFKGYVYADATAATVQLGTKMQLVITADPNGLFSTSYTQMAANALLVSRYDDDNRMAWDVIQELVSIGDAAANRYTFGIYDGRQAIYAAIPDDTAYQHRIAGKNVDIETYGVGTKIHPWDVLPARWMFLPDFLVGRTQPTDRRLDPRYLFIESVRFTAPSALQISGQKVSRLPQMIARLSS